METEINVRRSNAEAQGRALLHSCCTIYVTHSTGRIHRSILRRTRSSSSIVYSGVVESEGASCDDEGSSEVGRGMMGIGESCCGAEDAVY